MTESTEIPSMEELESATLAAWVPVHPELPHWRDVPAYFQAHLRVTAESPVSISEVVRAQEAEASARGSRFAGAEIGNGWWRLSWMPVGEGV